MVWFENIARSWLLGEVPRPETRQKVFSPSIQQKLGRDRAQLALGCAVNTETTATNVRIVGQVVSVVVVVEVRPTAMKTRMVFSSATDQVTARSRPGEKG